MWSLSHVWLFATLLDCSPPGSCLGTFRQVLEWVAVSSSRRSSQSRDQTWVSCVSRIAGGFFTQQDIREAPEIFMELFKGRFAGDFSYNLLDFYWIIQLLGVFFFFNFSLVVHHSMWDLNSPTRDWSHTHCVEKWLSWTIREVLSGF